MASSSSARWVVGTLAIVAIALSVDSLRRTQRDFDAARAPQLAIRGQLTAFKRSDFPAAYRFAAPAIQEMYPLADFCRMVEDGFPELTHWRQLSLGASDVHGDTVAVPIAVSPERGASVHFVYWMRHEPGGWRVAGVERDHARVGPRPRARPRPIRPPVPQETTALERRLEEG
jgi:hypothetical protein